LNLTTKQVFSVSAFTHSSCQHWRTPRALYFNAECLYAKRVQFAIERNVQIIVDKIQRNRLGLLFKHRKRFHCASPMLFPIAQMTISQPQNEGWRGLLNGAHLMPAAQV
jgi:hypothetical protein